MPRRGALLVAVAVLLAVALVACGGGSDGATAETTSASAGAGAAASGSTTPTRATGPAAAGRGVKLAQVGNSPQPLYVTAPPQDRRRIFVVSQNGTIWVVRGGRELPTPFLDIRSQVQDSGEQ